jgi:dihydrofolate reductase
VRRLQLFVATSVDGYVTGPDGDTSWRHPGAELVAPAWPRVDTILMGWRTYETACASGWPHEGRRMVVFSRTRAPSIATSHTVATARPPSEVIADLRSRAGGSLALVAGGALAAACFAAGLVDEVFVAIHPVLLGGGTPWLAGAQPATALTTLSERRQPSGIVQLAYRVERGSATRGSAARPA